MSTKITITPQTDFSRLMDAMTKAVEAISEAMAIYINLKLKGQHDDEITPLLRRHFESVYPKKQFRGTGIDWHIVDGLHRVQRGHTARPEGELPRLVQLILLHVNEAFIQSGRLAKGHVLFPSPLFIAVEALTVPQEPHTRAYPLLAARMLLSHRLGIWPRNAFTDYGVQDGDAIDENTVIEEIGNCRTWVSVGDIWTIKADLRKCFIGNFMAVRGVLLMRSSAAHALTFLNSGLFSKRWAPARLSLQFQFRLSQKFERLPPPSDFMNEILGVPVAIRGMDNVFFNGIKPSVGAGLVMQLSGGPGSGKTTFALALAAALAPLGTQSLYFSFEEEEGDLASKLRQQSQPRLKNLSYHQSDDSEWFKAYAIPTNSLAAIQSSVIDPLMQRIGQVQRDWPAVRNKQGIVPPLPFLVVLDSLSALSLDAESASPDNSSTKSSTVRQRLAAFVNLCRQMRVFVILVTSDNRSAWGDLDYVVDMVVNLKVEGADEHNRKPIRLFNLSKSRQQISRHGTHIFHLSGDSGFRIAPQLSSQMDAQQDIKQLLWDRHTFIESLNVRRTESGGYRYADFIKLHWRSQILLQGRGSSGKAGLALKIALSPKYAVEGFIEGQQSPRILIVSFLYPGSYYDVLQMRLQRAIVREAKVMQLRGLTEQAAERYVKSIPPVSVIHLTPGTLHAEDLHSMMVRRLEEGRLSGRPYTAAIIDGLHNLALQFPGASESSYLFPILYGTLSRANVTTITTFTTLAINSSEHGLAADANEESVFRLRVHLPLLHTLVQASDYVIEIVRAAKSDRPGTQQASILQTQSETTGVYLLRVQSAISRDPPSALIGWNRQEMEFTEPGTGYEESQRELPID